MPTIQRPPSNTIPTSNPTYSFAPTSKATKNYNTKMKSYIFLLTLICLFYFLNFLLGVPRKSFIDEPKFTISVSSKNQALSPVHLNSSWIGNQWIPSSEYRLYEAHEFHEFFSSHSVLVVGDSTARRTFGTLFALINSTTLNNIAVEELDSPSVIDVNKKKKVEFCKKENLTLCRSMPGKKSEKLSFDLISMNCLKSLRDLVSNSTIFKKQLSRYSIVIFIIGPWEWDNMWQCIDEEKSRKENTEILFENIISLSEKNPNVKFIWRTWAGPGSDKSNPKRIDEIALKSFKKSLVHNHLVKKIIHDFQRNQYESQKPWTKISYIDWGHVMGPRLFPQSKRIKGDIDNHFGLEARITFLQMLINHLIENNRQEKKYLKPWWAFEDINNDCFKMEGSDLYCLSNSDEKVLYTSFLESKPMTNVLSVKEAEKLKFLNENFCEQCLWLPKQHFTCLYRRNYLIMKKKMSLLSSIENVLQNPDCKKNK